MSIPGLPSLPSDIAGVFSEVVLVASDLLGFGAVSSQWGLFLNGEPVVIADSVLSIEFTQDFSITNAPVEQGSFASYNKVQRPFETTLRFATGGSIADRQNLINSIAAIIGDTNLYDVVTPEVTYTNLNLVHQNYLRSAERGAGLLTIDVRAQEVRPAGLVTSSAAATQTGNTGTTTPVSGTSDTSVGPLTGQDRINNGFAAINAPQDPAASPVLNGGNVQPQTPTAAQNSQFTSALTEAGNPFND
jgi:hypothetical protein